LILFSEKKGLRHTFICWNIGKQIRNQVFTVVMFPADMEGEPR